MKPTLGDSAMGDEYSTMMREAIRGRLARRNGTTPPSTGYDRNARTRAMAAQDVTTVTRTPHRFRLPRF